ncbi:MAG: DUF6629 family protein [Pseudomonadota bacterium]
MCFSATASFAAAAILSSAGTSSLGAAIRAKAGPGLVLLACFPLLFALQQAGEGLVWLGFYGAAPPWITQIGTGIFLFAAYVAWPILGPVTGWLIEPPGLRRNIFAALIAGGVLIAGYLAYAAISHPQQPMAMGQWGGHIWYMHEFVYVPHIETLYFVTACTALLLSSNRIAFWFALVLTVAFAITMWGYNINVVPSVWCFFAAAASLVIVVGIHQETPETAVG